MRVLQALAACLLPLVASGSPVNTIPPIGSDVCLDESSIPSVATNLDGPTTPMAGATSSSEKKDLPVFFFHGLTGNSTEGFNFQANLTAEGRVFVPLAFCERECSLTAMSVQVPMAIAAVRQVVANDERFEDGYIFIGHSQGAMMARAVIEQMDDHKVHTFVSLAGGVNGIFYGPQEADRNSIHDLGAGFGAAVLPQNLFDFTGYTPEGYRGEMQADLARRSMDPKIQAAYSITNLGRTPVRDVWLATNEFLPMINNVNTCAWFDFHCHMEKIRRKNNFLRLKEAHFFASPEDGVASPWQGSLLGHYSELDALDEIESKFESLAMVEMHDTVEYKHDTYGLRTLDERGALFRSTAPGVPHCCWLYDFPKFHEEGLCEFHPLYGEYVYNVLW
jgi:palmitoyl-protein thioesterase